MKTSLITGGVGFLGLHLAKHLLEEGHRILLVDNLSRGVLDAEASALAEHDRVEIIQADLIQESALKSLTAEPVNYVFHFAAIIGVQHVLNRPYEVLSHNLQMLDRVIRWARNLNNLERFVFASTSEVTAGAVAIYDAVVPTPEVVPLTLTNIGEERTSYMMSKIYGEAMCAHSGLPFTIIRPHNIYGPRMGMSHIIPELLKKAVELSNGMPLEVYSTDHQRAFCFVSDAVKMITKFTFDLGGKNQTLNLGNQSQMVTMREVGEAVLRIVGKQGSIKSLPATPGSPSKRCPDMSKVIREFNLEAATSLEEGIRKTYEWYGVNVFGKNVGPTAI